MGSAQAQLDITMTIFLFIGLALLALVQNKVSAELDESRQSAQDYSIVVDDPGDDDIDCDEWQVFFSQFGHVTFVTVAFNNAANTDAPNNGRCNRKTFNHDGAP